MDSEAKEIVRDDAEVVREREDEFAFGVARARYIVTTLGIVTVILAAEDRDVLSSLFTTARELVDGFGLAEAT